MTRFATLSAVALAVLSPLASASWQISGATSGVDKNTGARPFRLPIEELQASGPAWDLYVQAMQFWMSIDQENMFSWYGIAGIHGLPNIPWDGQNSASGSDQGYYVGYGTHTSVLFPTWHRPFCALYEEIISIYAHQVAETYPQDKIDQYRQAADNLRMPYWDWTTNATIPDIFQQPKVTINAAWGSETIDNPMFRYNWHPYDSSALDNIYSNFNWTVRAPTDQGQQSADQQLAAQQQQLHDGAYTLFSSQKNYTLFSNTNANDGGAGHQSLENIHNTIHLNVGGDMTYLWIAAHDPIFFLHHANVDRLFTIWQAIYPDAWIESQVNTVGTFYTPPNTTETSTWPLAPFHKDENGAMFTSDDVRYTKNLGYAYKEVIDWNVTAEQLTKNTITWVNQKYNPNGSGAVSKRSNDVGSAVNRKSATASDNQYVLNLKVDKSKINGSMTINFAINNHTVGSYPVLTGGTSHTNMVHPPIAGQLGLTHSLLTLGCNLNDRNGTLNTIAKGMSWTATTSDGKTIQPSDLQDGAVQIQVSTRAVKQTSPEDQFPDYEDWSSMAQSQLGQFASQVLGASEDTIKQVTEGITNALEGIL